MKPFLPERGRQWIGTGLFLIGVIATIIATQIPALNQTLHDLEHSGYFGAIIAGVLYAISLTSATATLVFTKMPDTYNPMLIALAGGFGAMLYDLTIFSLTRRANFRERVSSWVSDVTHHSRLPRWLSLLIGAVMIASPLPDELGASFFGFSAMPPRLFILLSFGLNTAGILVLTGLFS